MKWGEKSKCPKCERIAVMVKGTWLNGGYPNDFVRICKNKRCPGYGKIFWRSEGNSIDRLKPKQIRKINDLLKGKTKLK